MNYEEFMKYVDKMDNNIRKKLKDNEEELTFYSQLVISFNETCNKNQKQKEVSQKDFWDYQVDEQDGYYYGQSHFQTQEIWIDKDLPIEKKKKTLYHELTHVYIREYLTSRDINPNEEVLCDIAANSHDIIHKIVKSYFKEV